MDSFWEDPKTFHFHGFRSWLMWTWLPKPIIFNFGYTRLLQIIQEKTHHFRNMWFWKISKLRTFIFLKFMEKVGTEHSWRIVWDLFENVGYEINIYKNMKCFLNLCNFEKLKLWTNVKHYRSSSNGSDFDFRGILIGEVRGLNVNRLNISQSEVLWF